MMKDRKLENRKPESNTFNVPKGYFEQVEDAVFSKLTEEQLPKTSGFEAPKGYFDEIETQIWERTIADKLHKHSGFTTPDSYFETIEDRVLASSAVKANRGKVIHFKKFLLQKVIPLASAAAVALILFLNLQNKKEDLNSIAASEIENWIENDQVIIDPYQIAEVYSDVELTNGYSAYYDEADMEDFLEGSEIENLLIENN